MMRLKTLGMLVINPIKLLVVFLFFCCISGISQNKPKSGSGIPQTTDFDRLHHDSIFSREWGKVISLDGQWQIAEGNLTQRPKSFKSVVPVPGLVSSAKPSFEQVGIESPKREAFWYRKKFSIQTAVPEIARLKIFKSMYGTKVWLNGHEVGESSHCFTPLYFNLQKYLKGNGQENELVIRIGAHISQLPDTVVSGGDAERHTYPPGIYDRVELIMSDDPFVLNTQVVPDIDKKVARVFITFATQTEGVKEMKLNAVIQDYKTGEKVGQSTVLSGSILKDRKNTVEVDIPIANCKLWTPETPNLYILKLNNQRYSYSTRFGMRTFSLEKGYSNRALLNGKPYFIRGTNFAIHRFLEDPLCLQLPWTKEWVRKLISQFTKMEMNGCRFTIGPAPEMWYDIADEEGMIVFDEFAIWYAYQPDVGSVKEQIEDPIKKWGVWPKNLSTQNIVTEFTDWMQERWNHACVLVWDAQNETWAKQTGEAIQKVRSLDLSNRPWDNGWSPPADSTDMREAHNYFEGFVAGTEMKIAQHNKPRPFLLSDVPNREKVPSTFYLPYQSAYNQPSPNYYWQWPCVINEYSYLWLKRDGEATLLTKDYYNAVLGENATANDRREFYAKYLAAITEYWRATRSCFGVMYFGGLGHSLPECQTSDNFTDINTLDFDQYYKKYVPDAFSSLGVCLELWQQKFTIKEWWGTQAEFPVTIINDTDSSFKGQFRIKVLDQGNCVSETKYNYETAPLGLSRTMVKIELPQREGKFQVVAEVEGKTGRTIRSYRDVEMVK